MLGTSGQMKQQCNICEIIWSGGKLKIIVIWWKHGDSWRRLNFGDPDDQIPNETGDVTQMFFSPENFQEWSAVYYISL